jgi:ubiquitin C-terminal hydrolase
VVNFSHFRNVRLFSFITGANSGHYTAYAKHPVGGQWYYYNDETVTETHPGEDEFTSTYVLFYQRKGMGNYC